MSEDVFVYAVDSDDVIIHVSDNWRSFAHANDWHSEDVVGHKLWDYIEGLETRHLYEELFKRVRAGTNSRPIPFRCDSPRERRFLELLIKALPDGLLEISSIILRTESRSPVRLLAADTPRSTDYLRMCSMCKMIEVTPGQWIDLEHGIVQLRLFEAEAMPQITHGLCHPCYLTALEDF